MIDKKIKVSQKTCSLKEGKKLLPSIVSLHHWGQEFTV
jgi:hypothetical protein